MAVISNLSVSLTANTKGIERGLTKARKKVNEFSKSIFSIKSAVAGALGIGGVGALVTGIINTNTEMQKLKSSLKTVTGSAENASIAFSQIEKFATNTPYDLNQVVDSFIKLKAYGLDPSERALTSYGNTASAMGKSLNQMIEAVADAATGEFERLKEFGIKAKTQGDNVTFTFQGVATTVKKNSEEIQKYLLSIGETKFGNAMSDQMGNLAPAFSNLRASIQGLQVAIGESGLNDFIAGIANNMTSWIKSLDQQKISDFTHQVMNSFASFIDTVDGVYKYISGNKFLQASGIIGYALFGKWGIGAALMVDKVNTMMAKDLAQNWEFLNPSQINAKPLDGYKLGSLNDSNNSLEYFNKVQQIQEKYGKSQVDKQSETNSILQNIAEQLRKQTAAVAG